MSLQRCSVRLISRLWLVHSCPKNTPILTWLNVLGHCWKANLPQPHTMSALEQAFLKNASVVCSLYLVSQSPQHDAATTVLHGRDGTGQMMSTKWVSPRVIFDLQAKLCNLVSWYYKILLLMVWESFMLQMVMCCRIGWPFVRFSNIHTRPLESSLHDPLATSLSKALLLCLLGLASTQL